MNRVEFLIRFYRKNLTQKKSKKIETGKEV